MIEPTSRQAVSSQAVLPDDPTSSENAEVLGAHETLSSCNSPAARLGGWSSSTPRSRATTTPPLSTPTDPPAATATASPTRREHTHRLEHNPHRERGEGPGAGPLLRSLRPLPSKSRRTTAVRPDLCPLTRQSNDPATVQTISEHRQEARPAWCQARRFSPGSARELSLCPHPPSDEGRAARGHLLDPLPRGRS